MVGEREQYSFPSWELRDCTNISNDNTLLSSRMTSQGFSAHLVWNRRYSARRRSSAPVVPLLPSETRVAVVLAGPVVHPSPGLVLPPAFATLPAEVVLALVPAVEAVSVVPAITEPVHAAEKVLALAAEAVPPPPQYPSYPSICPSSSVPPNASPLVLSAQLDVLLPPVFRRKAYPKHRLHSLADSLLRRG